MKVRTQVDQLERGAPNKQFSPKQGKGYKARYRPNFNVLPNV